MPTDALPLDLTPPGVAILAGPFGSGKTEIAINLAIRWAAECPTYLADLDVVTPYFRSREHVAPLTEAGVTVLAPEGVGAAFDTPVLPTRMPRALADSDSGLVIDIGGQRHGAGVLVHWQEAFRARDAKIHFVINPRRPGAADPRQMAALADQISSVTGLPYAGVIANGNIGKDTVSDDVLGGLRHARDLGEILGVSVSCACCPAELASEIAEVVDVPVLALTFYLRPPWERG